MASKELQVIIDMLRANPLGGERPSLEQMRAGMSAAPAPPLPDDVVVTPVSANGVPCEWVSAGGASTDHVLMYVHGGGYALGSVASHRDLVSRLSSAAGMRVLNVDYRLAPEHPFPAAVDDAATAYRWLLAQGVEPSNIAIGGDSAGGGLTVATLLALRDSGAPLPAAALCISPWADLTHTANAYTERAAIDPMVTKDLLDWMADMYLGERARTEPLASPALADLSGLPPMLIQVGTAEVLYDDSVLLAERATAVGCDVTLEPWQDMIHVWHMQAALLPEAREAIERAGAYLRDKVGMQVASA